MKFKIEHYEIEIKAKEQYSKRNNAEDAMAFMNMVSLYLGEAATSYSNRGRDMMAEQARTMANDIYRALSDIGYYKDC